MQTSKSYKYPEYRNRPSRATVILQKPNRMAIILPGPTTTSKIHGRWTEALITRSGGLQFFAKQTTMLPRECGLDREIRFWKVWKCFEEIEKELDELDDEDLSDEQNELLESRISLQWNVYKKEVLDSRIHPGLLLEEPL